MAYVPKNGAARASPRSRVNGATKKNAALTPIPNTTVASNTGARPPPATARHPSVDPAVETARGTRMAKVSANATSAKATAVRKNAANPARAITTSPSDGPTPLVSMPAEPKTAIPSARRPAGTRSAAYVK